MTRLLIHCKTHYTVHDAVERTQACDNAGITFLVSQSLPHALEECSEKGLIAYVRDAKHVMIVYRTFLTERKLKTIRDAVAQGKDPGKGYRSLIHYTGYVRAYLKAKRAVSSNEERVNA